MNAEDGQVSLFGPDGCAGKTCLAHSAQGPPKGRTSASSSKKLSELRAIPYMFMDLTPGHGDLLGNSYWEIHSPWLGGSSILNTGPAPLSGDAVSTLSSILEAKPHRKYYLSRTACLGILRRAETRGKELPSQLELALMAQAGLIALPRSILSNLIAFAANQRDEVRDLHNIAGALSAQPGMKQQTFIAQDCLNPWDTQQARVYTPESKAPTLAGADGGGGRNPAGLLFVAGITSKGNGECFLTPERHTSLSGGGGQAGQGYPCVLTAGFCAGAGPSAGSVGYQDEVSPTLKASASGNMMPSILCLNDQGGSVMECSENVTGTLRAQEHGHQPLVFDNHGQDSRFRGPVGIAQTVSASFGEGGNNQPLVIGVQQEEASEKIQPRVELFENHGVDARYTGPHPVSPTLSCRAGTGGNNLPIMLQAQPATYSRQRVDIFVDNDVASTESARQYKDATDLVCQAQMFGQAQFGTYAPGCATLRAQGGDHGGGSENLVVSADLDVPLLIRRLTPLECERLQGYPDHFTDLPGASDSARYRALGNSVSIPCVEYIMRGFAMAAGA